MAVCSSESGGLKGVSFFFFLTQFDQLCFLMGIVDFI